MGPIHRNHQKPSMTTLHASQPILDAIEKIYGGQWQCICAMLAEDGTWTLTFVDVHSEEETQINQVSDAKAVPILRDMLAHAESHADSGD